MKSFYVPKGITDDYCYIVPGNGYYDIYNTDYLNSNTNYTYYRFYDNVDSDIYQELIRSTSSYNYGTLNAIQVEPKHDYIYRKDYPQILQSVFILTIGFVVLFNIMTSFFRKGGVLSGLL